MKKREYHGGSKTRLYRTWCNMRDRCNNPDNKEYKNYGGRGIKVCKEWYEFSNFRAWAESVGYNYTLTIERILLDKGYCPSNCRFIPLAEQANNRTNNHYITYKGKTQTLMQWSKELGIPYYRLRSRINNCGFNVEEAFSSKSFAKRVEYTYKGVTKSLAEWCKELGLDYSKTRRRLQLGWSVEKAFEEE